MATQNKIQPYYIGNMNGTCSVFKGGPEFTYYKETASQSYGVGDLIYLDTNGTIAIATATTFLAGQALTAATGTTGASVYFRAITPGDLFVMNVYHSTAASAVSAQTQLGTVRGLVIASSKWHCDIENSVEGAADANARVQIVDFPTKHPDGTTNTIGDVYGLVTVRFLTWSLASDGDPQKRILQLA